MYDERLEKLIESALADGELTEKEKQILFKNAQAMGVDLDEFEMVLDAKLYEKKKAIQREMASVQPQVSSAPKSNKFGDVRKCPQCGTVVQTMQVICPGCGHEFSGIGANSSSEKLSIRLQEISKEFAAKKYSKSSCEEYDTTEERLREADICSARADVISTFPIPNTKEDLLEFAITMQTGAKTNKLEKDYYGDELIIKINKLHHAYVSKFEECISKMKLMFPADPMFKTLLEQIEQQESQKKGFFGKLFGKFGI